MSLSRSTRWRAGRSIWTWICRLIRCEGERGHSAQLVLLEETHVALGCLHIPVAGELADVLDGDAGLPREQRDEGMPKHMERKVESRSGAHARNDAVERLHLHAVARVHCRDRIAPKSRRRA